MKSSVYHLLLLPLLVLLCWHFLAAVHGKVNADYQHSIFKIDPRFRAIRSDVEVNKRTSQNHVPTSVGNSSQADFPCPASAAIVPCTCTVNSKNRIYLNCTFVESLDQLVEVFQQEFPVKELYRFIMANNSVINWFPSFMNGITFESVYLYPGPFILKDITSHFLYDLKDTLKEFVIRDSQLTADLFPFFLLPSMNQFESLRIYYSGINRIPQIRAPNLTIFALETSPLELLESGTFSIGTGPMNIFLNGNQIHTIEVGSIFFADETSANSNESIHIDVFNNQLRSLRAGTFILRNGQITVLLEYNQISSIEPGTFVLPASTDLLTFNLNLSYNYLVTVDEAVFGSLMPFTRVLRLAGNPLTCGCDMAWLILNQDFLATVGDDATCADGTNLHELDPQQYIDFC